MSDENPVAPDAATRRARIGYVVGGVLIALAVALGVWALVASQNQPATPVASPSAPPSASASPAASPSASPSAPAPTPTAGGGEEGDAPAEPDEAAPSLPVIGAFAASDDVAACENDRAATVPMTLSWSVEGADEVFVGVDTSDAAAQPFASVDARAEAYTGISYACAQEEQSYTLTARNAAGAVSASVTVVRVLP
jgi:hypothetical protein